MNDRHRDELSKTADFRRLNALLDEICSESNFREYAASQGITATDEEWNDMKGYIMTQVRALTGRYSALDDEAFYKIFLDIDQIYQTALNDSEPMPVSGRDDADAIS